MNPPVDAPASSTRAGTSTSRMSSAPMSLWDARETHTSSSATRSSEGPTFAAGLVTTTPLTVTRPSRTNRVARVRERASSASTRAWSSLTGIACHLSVTWRARGDTAGVVIVALKATNGYC